MSHEKILIIEDDDDIAELVRYNLVKDGFRPVAVSSGEAALDRMNSEPFDLVRKRGRRTVAGAAGRAGDRPARPDAARNRRTRCVQGAQGER